MIVRASSPVVRVEMACTGVVITPSTLVFRGSRCSRTTRSMTSRSLKMPARPPSSTMRTLPIRAAAMTSMASITVAVRGTVTTDLLLMAMGLLPLFLNGTSIHGNTERVREKECRKRKFCGGRLGESRTRNRRSDDSCISYQKVEIADRTVPPLDVNHRREWRDTLQIRLAKMEASPKVSVKFGGCPSVSNLLALQLSKSVGCHPLGVESWS